MFYCDECAKRNDWPAHKFMLRSYGPCEVCDKVAVCNDVPSRALKPMKAPPSSSTTSPSPPWGRRD